VDRLSPHLSVQEFLATSYRELVEEQERAWSGNPGVRANAARFAETVFEPVRAVVGPLRVTSGYRCGHLNRAVGGTATSRHVLGLAADVQPLEMSCHEAMLRIAGALAGGELPHVDKAILEMGRWIHLQAAASLPARLLALETGDGRKFTQFRRIA
jgi:hypothetical protein